MGVGHTCSLTHFLTWRISMATRGACCTNVSFLTAGRVTVEQPLTLSTCSHFETGVMLPAHEALRTGAGSWLFLLTALILCN